MSLYKQKLIIKILEEEKYDYSTMISQIKVKENIVVLYRDKIIDQLEKKEDKKKEGNLEEKIEKVDEIIGKFQKHFKEQLVVYYKSSDSREGEIRDEPIHKVKNHQLIRYYSKLVEIFLNSFVRSLE
ncbi:MAG: hypothetical protein KAU62_08725 [Candidatus Heimdallarchaeota archaeon]|nr:hypothetical protein [Candidatus Heimdallarchaeota archaeon]MCK4611223.1 hypothetical protein [Candidatus Heimdallarchaeota archaeon]